MLDASVETPGSIGRAMDVLVDGVGGLLASVFVFEHGRLWLVAQRGYAVVPDGMTIERGVTGRAIRLGRAQLVTDTASDADYVGALPSVVSELAVPLRLGRVPVGVLNVEAERRLPSEAMAALRPLARALAPLAERLRDRRSLDLAALARLFVHLGSLREPVAIADLAAAALSRALSLDAAQVLIWDETGGYDELALADANDRASRLGAREIEAARGHVDLTAAFDVFELPVNEESASRSIVWLPLRANASELGALVGVGGPSDPDPAALDTAAVLAAHVAASLDAAFALERERRSAVSDPLTGILNRRGLEARLDRELGQARERRMPLSLVVIDCDDFKEVNDRAGHEFGDTILREIADVLSGMLRDGAEAARIGGDEFVVMLPGADANAAEAAGRDIRAALADGLTDAGYPVRVSAGIATYPFDGGAPTALLRAADQALYAAKADGKDRIASFRELTGRRAAPVSPEIGLPGSRRGGRAEGSMLTDAVAALRAIDAEETALGICQRLCKSLVFVVGATGCTASRVVGELVVDAIDHALREVRLSDQAAYRIADFPLTAEVLRSGRPRAVSFAEGEVDPAEAFLLRDLGMNAVLMLPLMVGGEPWGLVELYEMRLRAFGEEEIAVAQFLTHQAERRLEAVGDAKEPPRDRQVYELPRDARGRVPRTR
jgi:diguanylate cyclase (GGDEF)-like protein